MEKYSSYKDSGFAWMGQIPSHWETRRFRFLLAENSLQNTDLKERTQLQFKYGDIVPKANQNEDKDVLDTIKKYTVVAPGDIMINGLNLNYDFISQRVAQVQESGVITSAYVSLRPLEGANSKYYTYYMKAMDAQKMFHGMGSGVRLTLSYDNLKNLFFPYPSPEEQEAIVAYLDAATAKIDEAIAQQQRMIDLLNERKQIIINDAVSSGLGNEFSALTSFEGRESITIPKGWRLLPLKAKISFVNGYAFDSESFMKEGEVPVIRISNISDGTVSYDDIVYVDRDKGLEPFLTKGGDLLIAMSGATTGKVGFDIDGGSYINQRVGIIRSSCQKWVYYWLMTSFFKEYVYLSALGSAQPNISSSGIKNFRILYPEDGSYSNIVDRLDVICQEIDKDLGAFQHQIDLLQERKQIIINDVVTGKVKVI